MARSHVPIASTGTIPRDVLHGVPPQGDPMSHPGEVLSPQQALPLSPGMLSRVSYHGKVLCPTLGRPHIPTASTITVPREVPPPCPLVLGLSPSPTMLRPQQAVEDLLDHDGVELDEFGQRLDHLFLHPEGQRSAGGCKGRGHGEGRRQQRGRRRRGRPDLLQPVEDGDEEPDVRQPLVVEVADPLHQLGRGGHCQEGVPGHRRARATPPRPLLHPPLSVRLCRQRVTSVSAPLGQFSTSSSSSGEFIPIPRIWGGGEEPASPGRCVPSPRPHPPRGVSPAAR